MARKDKEEIKKIMGSSSFFMDNTIFNSTPRWIL
jgi:hypothetical protein